MAALAVEKLLVAIELVLKEMNDPVILDPDRGDLVVASFSKEFTEVLEIDIAFIIGGKRVDNP